jgi:hypothetical protein
LNPVHVKNFLCKDKGIGQVRRKLLHVLILNLQKTAGEMTILVIFIEGKSGKIILNRFIITICFIFAETKTSLMKKNMGIIDIAIRIVVAVIIAVLYFTHIISGMFGIILLIFAGVFILTSLLGFCPLYLPIGLNTRKKE